MQTDAINSLAELRDELDVAAQRMAKFPSPAVDAGSDSTGTVTTTVDASGRITQVSVAQGWRRLIAIQDFGGAVRQAATAASQAQLTAWAEVADGLLTSEPSARPLPLPHESLGARLAELTIPESSGERRRAALEELLSVLDEAERSLDEAVKRIETRETLRYTGFSKSRHVMVSVNGGGEVAEVRCEPQWLNAARESAIGREVTEAFHTAYQDLDAAGDNSARRALDEFQRLAQDPRALARRLYLCDD